MLIGYFEDEVWPYEGLDHVRRTVRCFLENDEGKYAMLRIKGEDIFGVRNHLETPGGGIEVNESYHKALRREIKEELGFSICRIREIGTIVDTYNILHRVTKSTFFHAYVDQDIQCEPHLTELEKSLFDHVEWYTLEELMKQLNPQNKKGVELLVNQRDYQALRQLEKMKEMGIC